MTHKEKLMTRAELLRSGVSELLALVQEAMRHALSPVATRPAPKRRPARPLPLRPPGAVGEAEFLARCTRCDDCLTACPHWVIRKAGPELGSALAGTPVIVPRDNPCLMCDGLPCAAACRTGALKADPAPRAIGLAAVDPARCYSAGGQPCDYCHTQCPTRPRAIARFERGAAPVIEADRCTGCGVCSQLCPAGAIAVRDVRPAGGVTR